MRKYLLLFIVLSLLILTTANLSVVNGKAPMSSEQISKKIQEVNAKPPAEIVALIPQGTTKTNLVFGPDYGTYSYVRIEFMSELLNKDMHLYDRATLALKCNLVDPNSQMAKMVYIQGYQEDQKNQIAQLRESLKSKKYEESSNQYGKKFAETEKYVEMGELGKNEKPHEEYYYHCTYIGRVNGAFFEFSIQCLPLKSKALAEQWFHDLVGKLGKLSVKKLCSY